MHRASQGTCSPRYPKDHDSRTDLSFRHVCWCTTLGMIFNTNLFTRYPHKRGRRKKTRVQSNRIAEGESNHDTKYLSFSSTEVSYGRGGRQHAGQVRKPAKAAVDHGK